MKYRVKIKNPIIGVPLTAIDKLIPEQFEILGCSQGSEDVAGIAYKGIIDTINYDGGKARAYVNNKATYSRILIRWKTEAMPTIDEDGVILYNVI